MARVLDRFVEDPAQEDLERATRLRVDVPALVTSHSLHAAAPRQPADGLLGYPLRRIPQRTPRAHWDAADRSVSRADLARLCIVRVSLAAAPVWCDRQSAALVHLLSPSPGATSSRPSRFGSAGRGANHRTVSWRREEARSRDCDYREKKKGGTLHLGGVASSQRAFAAPSFLSVPQYYRGLRPWHPPRPLRRGRAPPAAATPPDRGRAWRGAAPWWAVERPWPRGR